MAICALRLGESGVFDLDSRIGGEACSLRQLLGHTAGFSDYGGLKSYRDAVAVGGHLRRVAGCFPFRDIRRPTRTDHHTRQNAEVGLTLFDGSGIDYEEVRPGVGATQTRADRELQPFFNTMGNRR